MRAVALIPARGGSKRLPGKNIVGFHGRPIIAYTIAAAKECGSFERIVVSTEDEAIARVAERFGAAVEMRDQVMEHLAAASIVIKAAAVADFHLSKVPDQKVKKTAARISLELDPTPDILAELGRKKGDFLLVGFAAETQNLVQEARRKLESKNCDMVVGNIVGGSELGFESDENEVVLSLRTGESIALPRASKRAIADRIFDEVLSLRLALHAANGR